LLSAANLLEAAIVIEGRKGRRGGHQLDLLLAEIGIEIVPVDWAQVETARDAWRRSGKDRHPASLNFGDCFAYALAKSRDVPLLFTAHDFRLTDIEAVELSRCVAAAMRSTYDPPASHRRAAVEKRRSIEVPGVKHLNPIPAACRRGPFVTTGAISGADPHTGKVPEDLDAQCAAMFANVKRLIEAAGGTTDDIVKMTVWITDRGLRPTLNKYWVEMFPDPHSRPARHTTTSSDLVAPMQVQCDFFAVIGD